MSASEFEKTINLFRSFFDWLGVWPQSVRNINAVLKLCALIFFSYFFIIIPQTSELVFVKNSLDDVIDILLFTLVSTITVIAEVLNLWFRRQGKIFFNFS